MALLKHQPLPVRSRRVGRVVDTALRAYRMRQQQLGEIQGEFACHAAVLTRGTLARRFRDAVASGLEPTRREREAWVTLDREEEFWDCFGGEIISQALLPQD